MIPSPGFPTVFPITRNQSSLETQPVLGLVHSLQDAVPQVRVCWRGHGETVGHVTGHRTLDELQWPKLEQFEQQNKVILIIIKSEYSQAHTNINESLDRYHPWSRITNNVHRWLTIRQGEHNSHRRVG